MQVRHGRGYVYAIEYHIVWCTKYRKRVLWPSVERRLKELLDDYALEHGFIITEFNSDMDHVHLLIATTPHTYLPGIIKGMKGVSARAILQEFKWVRRMLYGGHLWSPSYFVATVSDNTEKQIADYIRSRKEKSTWAKRNKTQ